MFSGLLTAPFGQPKVPVTTKEFMREKLQHSQKLLGALATEDYITLQKLAERLSAMTQADWQAFQNPDYTAFSATFRGYANALTKASKDKNIDGATLAFVRMTMSCVDCHKFVRGKLWPKFYRIQSNSPLNNLPRRFVFTSHRCLRA